MITIQHPVDLKDTYPLERIGPLDSLLFFDIETTGFSGDTSSLYLIGCTFYDRNRSCWNLIQWFADTPEAEPELLDAFFAHLAHYSILIHFNGDLFDIPYLLKRCSHYGRSYDFSLVKSVDIYRKIRPYRKLLGMDSLKQKAIEQFLGIHRTDRYSGGQLIEVYQDYLKSHDSFLYDMLILHNEEDLKGMPLILPILNYPDMLEQDCKLVSQQLLTGSCLELVFESPCSVPTAFQSDSPAAKIHVEGNRLTCRIALYEGELKLFYPNYKDYYYLPCEDTAIHKSVGEYVAKEARVRATAKTCYTKKTGLFLPQAETIWQPAFRKECRDKLSYVLYQKDLFEDSAAANRYLHRLLSHC